MSTIFYPLSTGSLFRVFFSRLFFMEKKSVQRKILFAAMHVNGKFMFRLCYLIHWRTLYVLNLLKLQRDFKTMRERAMFAFYSCLADKFFVFFFETVKCTM